MFVYGFCNEHRDRIILAVAVDVALVQWKLSHGELAYKRENRLDQTFIGLQYSALRDLGAVLFVHDTRAEGGKACGRDLGARRYIHGEYGIRVVVSVEAYELWNAE
ncbi:MAG TPA: hypothetical protein VFO16_01105, partial [Pseudonocardiaceae bacterium]|nr:hypothetical protein [Pseudonocardiaceae bacterium]